MPRKVAYTQITPIPRHIPRQMGIDLLHSHGELIELNPLVLEYHQIKAPRDAPADEYFSNWYEITERIKIIPGAGKFGSSKINFRGVYHDMPWGLQTHVYPPGGIDLRVKYSIKGNQPGEPPEARELGSAAPADGLYLREDIEIKCNFTMVAFVKKGMKEASKVMIDRLIKKAELIDAELLRQMMDAHTLNDKQNNMPGNSPIPPNSPGLSAVGSNTPFSPNPNNQDSSKRHTMLAGSDVLRKREDAMRAAMYGNGYAAQPSPAIQHPPMNEMMGSLPGGNQKQPYGSYSSSNPGLAIEMEGDTHFQRSPQPSPALQAPRHSTYSELSGEGGRQSQRSSVAPGNDGMSSGWGGSQTDASSPRAEQAPGPYRYNPRDFASELPVPTNR